MNATAFDVMVPFRDALLEIGHDNAEYAGPASPTTDELHDVGGH